MQTSSAGDPMTGARIFVLIVFTVLAGAFLLSTGVVIYEFWDTDWITMLMAHSHLFVFFPTFGLLALCAIYMPSVVFTHFYWNHVTWGRIRFLFGAAVVAGASAFVALSLLATSPRGVWEVSPGALRADRGVPPGCSDASASTCQRAPALKALTNLRDVAQTSAGLSQFARNCSPDRHLELPDDWKAGRYCAATMRNGTPTDQCCAAQRQFKDALAGLRTNPSSRSMSALVDEYILHLKCFFVIVVLVIGVLLSFWRNKLDAYYAELVPAIERGLIICGFAMLIWPLMDYSYLQAINAMAGRWEDGLPFRYSLVMAPWTLLLVFHFLRRFGERTEMVVKIASVVVSAAAVVSYEKIFDVSARLVGIGAGWGMMAALGVLLAAGFVALFSRRFGALREATGDAGSDPR